MHVRNLFIGAGVFIVTILSAGPSWAQERGQAKADNTNPRTARFGVWDNSTNPNNVMTYEGYEKGGSKLTVSNPSNPSQDWSYVTLFDGVFRPVTGPAGRRDRRRDHQPEEHPHLQQAGRRGDIRW